MSKFSRKFGKILAAFGTVTAIAVSSMGLSIAAFAATAVTDGVMIRNDASTEAGIIGSLNEGDEVEILDVLQSGDGYAWYYIQLGNGNTGYVRSDLISADDSELAAFRNDEEAEPEQQEPAQEPEAEPEQAEPAAETEEAAQGQTQNAIAPVQEETTAEGYDALKDPNASLSVRYETDETGSGSWYVYNDDNGSRYEIGNGGAQEAAAADQSGVPGFWRTLAILFGILAVALIAFAAFLMKSIRDGRSKSSRRRALEAAEDEEEGDDDDFYFDDDEEDDQEDPEESEELPVRDSTITAEIKDADDAVEIPEEELRPVIEEEEAAGPLEDSEQTPETVTEPAAEEARTEEPAEDDLPAKDLPAKDLSDDKEAPAAQEKPAEAEADTAEKAAPAPAPVPEDVFEDDEEDDWEEEYPEEDSSEDSEEDDEEDDFDEEDLEEEDYYEEEDEDDDYEDDDDDEEDRPRRSASSKGGFLGFLSKIFGSNHPEDSEEEEDDDDDEEAEAREFDEFKDYPEDIDLLPREEDDEGYEEDSDIEPAPEEDGGERGRLTMQRVMKNVDYREEETDFTQEDDDYDLYDDDDDMEYSFISSTKRK